MTEMLAALLGATVGGLLSAWIGSHQTAKVLKHETDMAAAERREAQKAAEQRRQSFAADALIAAIADFTTVKRDDRDQSAAFARLPAVADVHRERAQRVTALLQAGTGHSHALPAEVRERWDALTWIVRFNQSEQSGRSEELRHRDGSDLRNYAEYVRRSLCAVSGSDDMPAQFPPPDMGRTEQRVWGFKPPADSDEPDLTDASFARQLVGKVKFTTGEVKWFGPNGRVDELPRETESEPEAER